MYTSSCTSSRGYVSRVRSTRAPMSFGPSGDTAGFVGTLLDRRYRVDCCVAEGGFGIVYRGHHIGLDCPVAIKALRPIPNASAHQWSDLIGHFLEEAKTMARLRHPGAVRVHDVGVTALDAFPAGIPWIAMEWIEGETLKTDLERRRGQGGRSAGETIRILRPVVEALAEVHEAGIAHRDLTPSNVMLVRRRNTSAACVVDFGIAKSMGCDRHPPSGTTTTQAMTKVFSAASAAPEQLAGTRTGPWTDVHALALLITEMLLDRSPYPLTDPYAHYCAVFDPSRPTPAKFGLNVGPLEPILLRALSLNPSARQPNAGHLLGEIDAALVS